MGTEVTILGRNPRLLKRADPEVSNAVLAGMARRMRVLTNFEVLSAARTKAGKSVVAQDRRDGKQYTLEAEDILIAGGRVSLADLLQPQRTGVEVDKEGWIKTNEYLETTHPNIWAMGDCVNRGQFRHTANYHSDVVYQNAYGKDRVKVDEHAIPSAVFSWPQVGSVGMTEEAAIAAGHHVHVGKEFYYDTAKGFAMGDREAFAKVVADATNGKILGAHVVGPQASVLVQLVVDLMNAGDLARAQTIHPALSEVVVRAFGNLSHPEGAPGAHGQGHSHDHGDDDGHGDSHGPKEGSTGPRRQGQDQDQHRHDQGHGH